MEDQQILTVSPRPRSSVAIVTEDDIKLGKILMKDGHWCVPPEERPKGWERLPVKESETAPQPPDPTPAEVAEAVGDVAEATRNSEPEPAGTLEAIALCDCGKPANHIGMCRVRNAKMAERRRRWKEHFAELDQAIHESARDFGAKDDLLASARIMVAGMWTRGRQELAILTGCPIETVKLVADRFESSPVWADPHAVRLGNIDVDKSDLELWLHAMVGTGELYVEVDKDGQSVFGLMEWKTKR
jgi:hypothetical protein